MRKLELPASDVSAVIATCAGSIENRDLAARLLAAQAHFARLEQEYALRANTNTLYTFAVEEVTHGISQEEMSWLYSRSFARKGSPTRPIYEALKMLAFGEICPLCNQRIVRTLDHHLSKQDYPAFAVTPFNLVPACRDCNSDTLARRMRAPEDQTFHPYFDDVDDEIWLYGYVAEMSPPVVRFEARPPPHWELGKRTKVEQHFRTFRLGTLYTTHAGSELQNIYGDVEVMARRGGALVIKDELTQRAVARRRVVRNTWQGAMYTALSASDWFCQGGFREIIA
jgi:hypothetical protein